MFKSILVVCTGNICRSPMAEALLKAEAAAHGGDVRVESAGIAALVGRPADPLAIELLEERGIDIRAHRARQLTSSLLRSFELVFVMETDQQRAIEMNHPTARGRIHRLGRAGDFDIPDSFRQGREAFALALSLIDRGLEDMRPLLWGRAKPR